MCNFVVDASWPHSVCVCVYDNRCCLSHRSPAPSPWRARWPASCPPLLVLPQEPSPFPVEGPVASLLFPNCTSMEQAKQLMEAMYK